MARRPGAACWPGCSGADLARGLIFAARHPRPRASARTCHGRSDLDLAEPAETAAAAMLAAAGDKVERIISSPARHALATARAVARLTGAPLHADDRLLEQDFGAWTGRAWATLPRAETDALAADPLHYRPGGGESVALMLARLRHAWTRIASAEENTLLVTHAGPIRCLLHIAGRMKLESALAESIAYGSVRRFEG